MVDLGDSLSNMPFIKNLLDNPLNASHRVEDLFSNLETAASKAAQSQ